MTPRASLAHQRNLDLHRATTTMPSHTSMSRQASTDKVIRRAQLIDVIVEKGMDGNIGEETSNLISLLGRPIRPTSLLKQTSNKPHSRSQSIFSQTNLRPSKPDRAKLSNLIRELVDTEQRYLKRVTTLKTEYADPLRKFARSPETLIIPLYDAKVMFANIDALVIAADVFAKDLQKVDTTGRVPNRGIGDVCLKHMKEANTFDCYRTYYDKQDESRRSFNSMIKRQQFEHFTESVKYSTTGIGNIGIRELLAEPIQRIPRYTLLWQSMVDCMPLQDPQRPKLEEAIALASKIALCEIDEQTKKATLMHCLERTIDGLPANLISHNRDLIDCIDVDDVAITSDWARPNVMTPSSSNHSVSSGGSHGFGQASPSTANNHASHTLHCTLLLFDDKLVIVKRQSSSISGRKVTGCEDIHKLLETGGGLAAVLQNGMKKDKLSFKGMVDLRDVIGVDVGELDFHLFCERPPVDQTDRWSGRPLRQYTVVHPPSPINVDLANSAKEKIRFLTNLWNAQALVRSKGHQNIPPAMLPKALAFGESVSAQGSEKGSTTLVNVFWNEWQKDVWLQDAKKGKVLVHLDEEGVSLPLEFGNDGPIVIIRLQPLAGDLCKLHASSRDPDEISKDMEILRTDEVISRIVQVVHTYGVFRFKTTSASCPNTPTYSHKLRPSVLNLDSISKNLFGYSSTSSRGDSSTTTSRRSRSIASRSSTMDTHRNSTVSSRSTALSSVDVDVVDAMTSPRKRPPSFITAPPLEAVKARSDSGHRRNFSEVRLNEQLDIARQNSATMATLAVSSQRVQNMAEKEQQKLSRWEPSPPSGPLKVVNRTPSPEKSPVPKSKNLPISPVEPLNLGRRKSIISLAPSRSQTPISEPEIRPKSPHSHTLEHDSPHHVGSSHTIVRVMDGVGRRVTEGRSTEPVREERENVSLRNVSGGHKRTRSTEELQPRKKTLDETVAMPRNYEETLVRSKVYSPTAKKIEETLSGLGWPSSRPGPVSPRVASGMTTASSATIRPERQSIITTSGSNGDLRELVSKVSPIFLRSLTNIYLYLQLAVSMRTVRTMKEELNDISAKMARVAVQSEQRQRLKTDYSSSSLCRSPQSRGLSRRADFDTGSMTSLLSSTTSIQEPDPSLTEDWQRNLSQMLNQLQDDLEKAVRAESTLAKQSSSAAEGDKVRPPFLCSRKIEES